MGAIEKTTLFRVHFAYADRPGEPQQIDVDATDPEAAKRQVQKPRGGCRLIFHKVKVVKGAAA
ncbi:MULTISPECIES: hypothetical protein [Aurantimonas]|uniref:hypothetical protein n=1 Tax=Aurantimonas TaxID=182269 RepID=UPI003516024F